MLLKKRQLGWDPYCKVRTDNWQQSVFKEIPEFALLTELAQSQRFWSADEVEKLETDYDKDLDVIYPEVPTEWECEDDAAPFFKVDPSPEPPVVPSLEPEIMPIDGQAS